MNAGPNIEQDRNKCLPVSDYSTFNSNNQATGIYDCWVTPLYDGPGMPVKIQMIMHAYRQDGRRS